MSRRRLVPGLAAFLLLVAALTLRSGALAAMALPFLAYLGAALALAPPTEGSSLTARRSCSRKDGAEGSEIEVEVRVRNEGRKTVCALFRDPLLPGMELASGSLGVRLALGPGEEGSLSYGFRTTRGRFAWKSVEAFVGDPFGLAESRMLIEAPASLVVRPRFPKLRHVHIKSWSTLPAPGLVPTRQGGSGTEFFGLREYRAGDSLKNIEWRRAAGHPRALLTREYVLERTADIVLVLDARADSDLERGGSSLLEAEIQAVASLAEMLLRQGQRLGLFVAGGGSPKALPGYGTVQLRRVLDCLASVRSGSAFGSAAGAERARGLDAVPVHALPGSALAIVVSPIGPDDILFFKRLRASGHQVLLIAPDPQTFTGPPRSGDWPHLQAVRACAMERRLALSLVARLSVSVIDWPAGRPIEPFVRAALGRPLSVRRV